jgi:hypothetical protein
MENTGGGVREGKGEIRCRFMVRKVAEGGGERGYGG